MASTHVELAQAKRESLFPLLLIVGYIAGVTLLASVAVHDLAAEGLMRRFMAGFFIVFSFFKLLDWPGFVRSYRMYDLIAAAIPIWAWAYPLIELALGTLYLLGIAPRMVNSVTLLLMAVGAVGVFRALRSGGRIRCACLGSVLNLPMTSVTLVEDLAMAAMALAMLAVHRG